MEEFYKLLAERKTNFTWYILSGGEIRGVVKVPFSLYHPNEVCPLQAVCSNSYTPILRAVEYVKFNCHMNEEEIRAVIRAADNIAPPLNVRKRLKEILFTEK